MMVFLSLPENHPTHNGLVQRGPITTSQVIGRWSCIPTVQVVGSLSALSGMELLVANAPRLLDFSFQRFSFFPLASQSGHLHEASLALTRP